MRKRSNWPTIGKNGGALRAETYLNNQYKLKEENRQCEAYSEEKPGKQQTEHENLHKVPLKALTTPRVISKEPKQTKNYNIKKQRTIERIFLY